MPDLELIVPQHLQQQQAVDAPQRADQLHAGALRCAGHEAVAHVQDVAGGQHLRMGAG